MSRRQLGHCSQTPGFNNLAYFTMFGARTLVLILALVETTFVFGQNCDNVYPQLSAGLSHKDETSCQTAGACWDGAKCYIPKIYGYEYKSVEESAGKSSGTLTLNEASGIKFGADFSKLNMDVTQETATRTHIKIYPDSEKRWEFPEDLLPRPGGVYTGKDASTKTIIKPQKDDDQYNNMEILVTRQKHGIPSSEPIFVFTKMLVFQDQYLQFVLGVPNNVGATYGIGESTRYTQALSYNSTYTLWATDQGAMYFEQSLYGTHPFYVQVTADGQAHGVLFLNNNGMDVTLTESATQGKTIGVQSTGGLIDIYIFAGPTPEDVVRQYQDVVGKPAMVPYWALGFHNCRWGYENLQYVEDVVANYSKANIPLEVQWTDIDYMDKFLDFTVSPQNFPVDKFQSFVKQLHDNNQRFVPIVDPAIYVRNASYSAYTEGLKLDVFVKDLYGKEPYLSQVWPGETYFPDWFAPNAQAYWTAQFKDFFDMVAYDGIWIDMNEASNFCNADGNGQVCKLRDTPCDGGCCIDCATVDPTNKYDYPPFVPNAVWGALGGKTIAMSGLHAGGILEYNAHNLYGFMESIATRNALLALRPSERPFVLSRSTTIGSGKYAAHWTGDNAATWDDLKASITTMNTLALFGMPITGADICGFNGETNEELCARWVEVGAFSPFSRDHNAIGATPQELYRWDSVAEAGRKALAMRYQLLPYLYSLTFNSHAHGDLLMRALWVNFPKDPLTLTQDGQYMWSDGLLFTPVLTQGATSVTGYFPQSKWYSLTDSSLIDATTIGTFVELSTDLTSTNVHVRGYTVIPMQGAAMTTTAARATPFTLLVALCSEHMAEGFLYLDDGVQEQLTHSSTVSYMVENNTLTSTVGENNYAGKAVLGTMEVLGVEVTGKRHGTAVPHCSATLTTAAGVQELTAESVRVVQNPDYTKLVLSFAESHKIVDNYSVSWKCAY